MLVTFYLSKKTAEVLETFSGIALPLFAGFGNFLCYI
jgi:hypothetical protein